MGVKVNMNNIKLISSAVAIAIGLSACQTNKESITANPQIVYQTNTVSKQIEQIPEWYLNIPSADDTIYSSGSARAPDLQLAVDIAIMNAKTTLADRINGKLDSMTKSFVAKIGATDLDTSVLNEIEKTSKNVIASVDVAGYVVDKSDITQEGTQYRAYVLLAYNSEEATKIMMNRMKRDRMIYSRIRSTEAWKELENEVNKSKEEDEAKSMENVERLIDENSPSI
jgi:hypothetical protein